jgi:hypothetical protein
MAEIVNNTMRQSCTVYKYAGADMTGQPTYGAGIEYSCRLAIRTERQITDKGDYITNSTVQILLPASTDIEAYDRIDLPAGYDQGAIIREVITATDQWGQPTHKAVRIA